MRRALRSYLATRAPVLEQLFGLGCVAGGVGAEWGGAWAAIVVGVGILVAPLLARRRD